MTNKEAAKEIQKAIDLIMQDGKDWLDERDIPILEMAINALIKEAWKEEHPVSPLLQKLATNLQDCKQDADDMISRAAVIRWVKTECNPYGKPTLDFESGKKVIEHLKQMPSTQPDSKEMSFTHKALDTISRQAAVDALKEHRNLFCDDTPDTFLVLPYGDKCRVDELDMAIATLINLPSAQPEKETAKFIRWMEIKKTDEYISYTPHCKCSKCGTEFLIRTIKYCYMCGARMEENDEGD